MNAIEQIIAKTLMALAILMLLILIGYFFFRL